MLKRSLMGAIAALAIALPATAQETYTIGLTGAMTGPAAGTLGPAVEGLRLYIDQLNAKGGIDGRKVNLILQDDSAEASKAAANVKRLVAQDNVPVLVNASLSSTYAPMLAETRRAGVPVLFMGAVCPKEVLPPNADPLQFCSTGFAQTYDSRAALAYVKSVAKGPVNVGYAAMAIPISRSEIDFASAEAEKMGFKTVAKEVIPPPTPDYTPFATKIKDAGANWAFSWAPWVTEIRTFEALRRLGWDGEYLTIAHLEVEGELPRVKDPKFYVMGANSFYADGLPIHKEIEAAAKAGGAKYPVNQMTEGWLGGLALEAALRKAGWPATKEKIAAAMSDLKVDTKGLHGVPMVWTKDNHFRTQQAYRVYRWDGGKIGVLQDWKVYDVQ
ncbi:ABC transporter substrate-binding protein [Pseudorhodoplanes sp.]|uniref:ABC transporter substrate-binding protein n=1 Tax=Pseudorhodoplanes sp. TaxID=1934341 RepID=UPI002C820F77|nr:ABC transporter substrate-binding protein [Pseudorhodoplanes sp.]HWV41196.1 ABC transporter substrate-binding protein [Pseudorhodoplanes sp.]